jgi:GrpB-like predicted nucleotidyltransferase (UPF0157 family)
VITIVPYRSSWPAEYAVLAAELRDALDALALRIDHIGSTAVPGLAAKDVIDIQVAVASLDPIIVETLVAHGYLSRPDITNDHLPPGLTSAPDEWAKLYVQRRVPQPVHVHTRVYGRANMRYALLFRDYLRANPASMAAYAQIKQALAHYHADDVDAYYAVKDPVCDVIVAAAEQWAALSAWQLPPAFGQI